MSIALIQDRNPKIKNIPAIIIMDIVVSRRDNDATLTVAFSDAAIWNRFRFLL